MTENENPHERKTVVRWRLCSLSLSSLTQLSRRLPSSGKTSTRLLLPRNKLERCTHLSTKSKSPTDFATLPNFSSLLSLLPLIVRLGPSLPCDLSRPTTHDMSASLARTVFRPSALSSAAPSQCPARHFYRYAARPSGSEQSRNANLMAHLAVLATLVVSAVSCCPIRISTGGRRCLSEVAHPRFLFAQQYYLSHPDTLMFDHPPRSAIGWPPSKHIAHRQLVSSSTSSSSDASFPSARLSSSPTISVSQSTRATTPMTPTPSSANGFEYFAAPFGKAWSTFTRRG